MKIEFSHKAYSRLEEIAEYIYEQSKSKKITRTYLIKFRHYIIQTLTHFPHAGRPSEELFSGTRKLVYQGYSIIYRVFEERVEILTIYRENLP